MKEMTVLEGLEKFFKDIAANPQTEADKLQLFATFMHATMDSVRRWKKGGATPQALNWLRAGYFLLKEGILTQEIKRLSPAMFNLGMLLVYDVVSAEDINRKLGYNQPGEVFRILRNGTIPSYERQNQIDTVCLEHKDKIAGITGKTPLTPAPDPMPQANVVVMTTLPDYVYLRAALAILISASEISLPQLRHLVSPQATSADRDALRTQVGTRFLFEISNTIAEVNRLLNALGSESSLNLRRK